MYLLYNHFILFGSICVFPKSHPTWLSRHNTLQGAMASSTLWSHALHVLGSADGADALMALSTLLGGLEERWEMAMGMLHDSQVGSWAKSKSLLN